MPPEGRGLSRCPSLRHIGRWLLNSPNQFIIPATDMRCEELTPISPEQGPDDLTIGTWDRQLIDLLTAMPLQSSFGVGHRSQAHWGGYLVQEHQPMRLVLVTCLGDDSGQMQVADIDSKTGLFADLTHGASHRAFTDGLLQFPTDW